MTMIELGGNNKPEQALGKDCREEELIRADVREEIGRLYKSDDNPVTRFLLDIGVLEDIEVLRRCIMNSKNNKEIYLYNNKLSGLKTYIGVVKDSYSVREKQTKIMASERETSADADEVNVVLTR